MKYAEAKPFLYTDGSLRDVLVLETTVEQSDQFLNYVRPMIRQGDFLLGPEVVDLPASYEEILEMQVDEMALLMIPVGRSTVNCHFLDTSELDLNIRPSECNDEESWSALSCFLQGLADAVQGDVLVTAENKPESVYMRFKPHQ
jgi:hypothetical protein